jgi:CRISPR/Cas system-associated protein Cas5 (RAMP superfamily)
MNLIRRNKMERLTQREEHCPDPKEIYGVSVKDHDYIATANRLADYEDTGLTPEEINKMHTYIEAGYLKSIARIYGIGIGRMKELAASDRKGRVVVLPCEVGDTV